MKLSKRRLFALGAAAVLCLGGSAVASSSDDGEDRTLLGSAGPRVPVLDSGGEVVGYALTSALVGAPTSGPPIVRDDETDRAIGYLTPQGFMTTEELNRSEPSSTATSILGEGP